MPRGRWGTVAEAAAHYGVTRQRINQLITKGSFAGSRCRVARSGICRSRFSVLSCGMDDRRRLEKGRKNCEIIEHRTYG